ncbi:MAG: GNAT family N-acetyltransferase [Gluconacetobacter diazotrophicus]|nr:GNAT family N-acetyltransferase [Gluconacetobacter diazotrophicus]
MATPAFRQAGPDDASVLLGLMRPFYAEEHLTFDPERTPAALRTLLSDPALGQVWLLEADGAAAGYFVLAFVCVLEFGGRCAFVDELFIRPEHRGRGLGTAALAQAAAVGAAVGLSALRLEVDHANPGAERLYRRAGFERHERAVMTRRLPFRL